MPLSDIIALRRSARLACRPGALLVNETTALMCSTYWSASALSGNPLGHSSFDRESLQVSGLTEAAGTEIEPLVAQNGNTDFDNSVLSTQGDW